MGIIRNQLYVGIVYTVSIFIKISMVIKDGNKTILFLVLLECVINCCNIGSINFVSKMGNDAIICIFINNNCNVTTFANNANIENAANACNNAIVDNTVIGKIDANEKCY